ncbi:GPI mannosyltransferase 2 [Pseudomyrmex gracilis]|uniref:GPI mannosyltransferase 2 n=1 Tax=Pseudomyrmex gracilis TaxID=219809 RepID=UPI0009959786|nr:GPI mannosyltransferase 2 [Pseudomyrmex gracilis]
MYAPRRKVFWFAIVSRLAIFMLQVIFNALVPDHQADAFRRPSDPSEEVSPWDRAVYFLFNGLTRWDGEYFLHVARYGYTYENSLAFYPLYPISIRVLATFLSKVCPVTLNIQSAMILAAVFLNFACFVKSALVLYDLTERVFQNTVTAYKAAILYCANPASIFFSAAYSESLFAYLTFYIMRASIERLPNVCYPLGLSILTRSNGMINIGFPVYFGLRHLCDVAWKDTDGQQGKWRFLLFLRRVSRLVTLRDCFAVFSTAIISLAPFCLLQMYNYAKFCTSLFDHNKSSPPVHVARYAAKNNLVQPGMTESAWCNARVPLAYSYVQKTYWNVGFLEYYNFKQIPNFILAFPILYITLRCAKEFVREHKDELYSLGLFDRKTKRESAQTYPLIMFVFVAHGLFLTIFCLLFAHIQISTRLLCSASPLIYWYCASIMSHDRVDSEYEIGENAYSRWKVFFLSQKRYTTRDKLVLLYFIGYTIVGCFMFSNFLPWT